MNLQVFVKVNFLSGLLGTLVLSPVAYAYEFLQSGINSPLLRPGPIDIAMLIVLPIIIGVAFAVTALAAFPLFALLQRKGLFSLS
ncbi:hypothetical protein HZ992_15170 [Rhizobacter sp. AJA081-3]|uniref:hypothetical protein n=1 Tax=Rhizobacter sp. AJA081-3 TaxID=2753607 RepID=UPI001AE0D76F|nr:hypothetical protein [Rhizobacter sp. AJA081-3]QTN21522.1 hypothetical protein HZ992_15170 [Rhizobacter sp. AJA081-3]